MTNINLPKMSRVALDEILLIIFEIKILLHYCNIAHCLTVIVDLQMNYIGDFTDLYSSNEKPLFFKS